MIRTKNIFRLSNRKFFQLVKEQNIQIMPEVPEDAVLSKYLSFKQQSPKEFQNETLKWQKQKQTKLNYSDLLGGSPHGSIQTFSHRNHQLTLISTNYHRVDEKKLHKVIYAAGPNAIVVQRRPQYHFHRFEMFPKGPDGVFSDRTYLDQLKYVRESEPGPQNLRPIVNALNKNKDDILEKNPKKQILQQKGFQICKKYSASYQVPMFLGEIPLRSYRQWIANTHTLMELQEIFKVTCHRLPRYSHLSFTPYQMATLIYPDIFLKINDSYMATVIQMLIAAKSYKKIVGVFGIIENEAIKHILTKNEALSPIIEYLVPPGPKGSIVRDIEPLEIVEKQIILDVMFFGAEVTEIKTQFFHITNAVMEKYSKDIDKKTLMKFRYDKTIQYLNLMQSKIKDGQEQMQKEFVRETLRDKKK